MLSRTHQPPRMTLAGRSATTERPTRVRAGQIAIVDALDALASAPASVHRTDAEKALQRAQRELTDALACAEHIRKGGGR